MPFHIAEPARGYDVTLSGTPALTVGYKMLARTLKISCLLVRNRMIKGELINIMKPHRLATIKAEAMLSVKCSISGLFDGGPFSRHENSAFC